MSNATMLPQVLNLLREDGTTPIEMKVGQIKLAEYNRALAAVTAENEFALVAIACGTSEAAVKSLSPESYEVLLGTVYQANEKGFFSFARRRKNSATERAMIHEMAAQVMGRQVAVTQSPSAPSSPGSPQRPA